MYEGMSGNEQIVIAPGMELTEVDLDSSRVAFGSGRLDCCNLKDD